MSEPVKTIDQARIRVLIRERLDHPEAYADRPVFIWQAEWPDGTQFLIIHKEHLDFNRSKIREDWKHFHLVAVRDETIPLDVPSGDERLVGYALYSKTPPLLEEYLKEVGRLINANNNSLPVIVYLPYTYRPVNLPGEQYIFIPGSDPNNH